MSLPLRHTQSDIVRRVLIAEGVGVDPTDGGAWPIFSAREPTNPDQVITVYDTVGDSDGRAMLTGELFSHPGVQIRIRATDVPAGSLKAMAVRHTMSQVRFRQVVMDGSTYLVWSLNKISDVMALGDESPTSRRQLFTINATVAVRRTA